MSLPLCFNVLIVQQFEVAVNLEIAGCFFAFFQKVFKFAGSILKLAVSEGFEPSDLVFAKPLS